MYKNDGGFFQNFHSEQRLVTLPCYSIPRVVPSTRFLVEYIDWNVDLFFSLSQQTSRPSGNVILEITTRSELERAAGFARHVRVRRGGQHSGQVLFEYWFMRLCTEISIEANRMNCIKFIILGTSCQRSYGAVYSYTGNSSLFFLATFSAITVLVAAWGISFLL